MAVRYPSEAEFDEVAEGSGLWISIPIIAPTTYIDTATLYVVWRRHRHDFAVVWGVLQLRKVRLNCRSG